jgi:hypothetical protein
VGIRADEPDVIEREAINEDLRSHALSIKSTISPAWLARWDGNTQMLQIVDWRDKIYNGREL